jgi:hypothetical protein
MLAGPGKISLEEFPRLFELLRSSAAKTSTQMDLVCSSDIRFRGDHNSPNQRTCVFHTCLAKLRAAACCHLSCSTMSLSLLQRPLTHSAGSAPHVGRLKSGLPLFRPTCTEMSVLIGPTFSHESFDTYVVASNIQKLTLVLLYGDRGTSGLLDRTVDQPFIASQLRQNAASLTEA